MEKLNNYCRNCGKKIKKGDKICHNCNTEVINERVKTDKKYILYVVISVICFLGFVIFPFLPVIGIIILVNANYNYPNNLLIKIFLAIEILIAIVSMLSVLLAIPSCLDFWEVLLNE